MESSPNALCSGKQSWHISHIEFYYIYGKYKNFLPLPLWLLVRCRKLPLFKRHPKYDFLPHPLWAIGWCRKFRWLESHSRHVLLRREVWFGTRNFLFYIWDKNHIASSYSQCKTAFTQMSPTRDWKWHCCNMYTIQWKVTSPNSSMLRKANFAFFPPRILLQDVG